jgi:hypothetical protein
LHSAVGAHINGAGKFHAPGADPYRDCDDPECALVLSPER